MISSENKKNYKLDITTILQGMCGLLVGLQLPAILENFGIETSF